MSVTVKRTAQISPDRLGVGIFAIALVMVVMSASMVFSYVAIAEAAVWTGVPLGIHWIAPVFIDGAIITYSVSLTIFEWRMEDRKTVRHTRRVLWAFTLLSVLLNFAHTASFWRWDFTVYEAWFGSLIAVSAPIAALLSAEEVVRLAFRRHRAAVEAAATAAEAEAALTPVAPAEVPAAVVAVEAPPAEVDPPIEAEPLTVAAVVTEETPEPAAAEAPEPVEDAAARDVVAEAERFLHADDVDDDGIIRFPAQGEVLIRNTNRGANVDQPF